MGKTTRDKDGKVTSRSPPTFEFDEEGGSIAVGLIDNETMEIIEVGENAPSLYGDFQPSAYLARALELLKPDRRGDIPDFRKIIIKATRERNFGGRCPLLEYCENDMPCNECVCMAWIEEEFNHERVNPEAR